MASPKFVMSTIVPTGLLIVGVFIFKREWLPIVSGLAAIFAGVQFLALTGGPNDPNVPLNKQTTESARSESVAAMPVAENEEPDAPMMKTKFKDYPLSNITKLSHNVAIYRFDLPSKTDALPLPTGQHLAVTTQIEGKDVLRSYTPVSSHLDLGYFDLLIKEYPTGNISKHIASLKVGDTLKVRGPKGAMVYEPNMCRHIGMIAGGTGLTPMLQIIQAIVRERPVNGGKDVTKVDFIFANVNEEDILLKDVLDKLAREDENFNVHYVLNNPPQGWTGGVGFVTADMIKEKLPAPASDIKILLCGPPPMISAMKKATLELGYEKARAVSKLADQVFAF